MPVGERSISLAAISASVATGEGLASDWKRWLRVPALVSTAVSSSVFHALHDGHWPSHFGLVPPHWLQV